jgi:hypothetical protein
VVDGNRSCSPRGTTITKVLAPAWAIFLLPLLLTVPALSHGQEVKDIAPRLADAITWSGVDDLGIGDRPRYLLLGESDTSFVSSPQFEGLITSNIALTLKCLNTSGHENCGSQSVAATGAGYSKDASLKNALDRARPQIVIFAKNVRH